jgi:amino acid adenylation domain-containing protein
MDLSGMGASEREESLAAAQKAEANRPILLSRDAMLRAVLYRMDGADHVLQLTMHHVVIDGWSIKVFFRDFAAFYNAAATGIAVQLPELPITFSDYARWQREQLAGPEGERLTSYWKDKIGGSSFALQLPTDRPRPMEQTFPGAVRGYAVSDAQAKEIKEFCLRERVTPFMVALTALFAVLARYSGQDDILIGSPIAARSQVETEELVGFMTNSVVMRGKLDGDPAFRELLQQVRQTVLEAFAHQDLPLKMLMEKILPERDAKRSAIFQVMLVYQIEPVRRLDLHRLETSVREVRPDTSKFDFTIELTPHGDGLDGAIEYNTNLFDSATIDRLWGHLTTYLERAIAAPEEKAAAISLLTPGERRQLLVEWNATERAYPMETSLAGLVEAQVERTPDAVAIVYGDQQLTYRELNQRANRLAHRLLRLGIHPQEKVGIAVERSPELIAGILAILKAGAAYVPIDLTYPQERRDFILRDCGIRFLLTVPSGLTIITECAVEPIDARFDADDGEEGDDQNPSCAADLDSLAYVMYTSGSTGRPKGVLIPHRGIVRLVEGTNFAQLDETQVFLHMAPASFDASTFEIWGALVHGARLVLLKGNPFDLDRIGETISRHHVTTLWLTSSLFNLIVDEGPETLAPVRQLLVGGEALSVTQVKQALQALPTTRIINGYGPTESTTFACCYAIPRDVSNTCASIPIGRPIANTRIYILDRQFQPLPVGVVGELYIGGDGLALGYLNLPELTEESFLPNPFRPGERIYKTGDLVRYLADGNVEFVGRIDHQVKIRGYRIELGEIEAALKDQPEIAQAVVLAREDMPGHKRLVAYMVASEGREPAPSELRKRLKQRLPDYMAPAAYVFLKNLPISPNGKIDRKSLPAPEDLQTEDAEESDEPRDPLEQNLATIWAEVLQLPRAGIHDDFFEMGGHSLLAVRLFSKILAVIPECRPSLALLLKAPTPAKFAQALMGGQAEWSYLVRLREGNGRPTLFFVSGAGGNVLSLRDLAVALPPDQPFYGLQARGLDGQSDPFFSVEEAAKCFVEQIRKVQPRGPYFLGGRSYGGTVAFEMACQLRALGETVGVLALIDTYNFAYPSFLSKPALFYFNARLFLRRTLYHLRILVRMKPRARFGYLLGRARIFLRLANNFARIARGGVGPLYDVNHNRFKISESNQGLEDLLSRVRNASVLAMEKFIPRPYDGPLLLIRASELSYQDPYQDEALGWRPVALGGITISEVDGSHDSILYYPQVTEIAKILDATLLAAQRMKQECSQPQGTVLAR